MGYLGMTHMMYTALAKSIGGDGRQYHLPVYIREGFKEDNAL